MAGQQRGGGGGVKAIKEKITFFKPFFLFCCHLKLNFFYFGQLIEIWTYHVKFCR